MSSKPSSRGSHSSQRPKLARAAATAPSLATSNASRKDLANLQSTRASALLTRVASYSLGSDQSHHPHQYIPRYSPPGSSCSSPEQHSPTSDTRKQPYGIASYHCKINHTTLVLNIANMFTASNYFSFPSFEDFQDYEERRAREGRPDKGIS